MSTVAPQPESPVVDVFLSYAREDLHFVRRLTDALRAKGRTVWVDLEGLYAGEQWWPNLCRAIDAATTIVFVLSPDSANSAACRAELDHATQHGKRIIPFKWRDPGDATLHGVLQGTQWLILPPDAGLDATIDALIAVLDSDPAWLRGHTRWLQFALDWDRRERADALLLRGAHLEEARLWLAGEAPSRLPAPIAVQRDFIAASERAELLQRARVDLDGGRHTHALELLLRAAEGGVGVRGHAMLFEALQRLRSCEPLHPPEHAADTLAIDRDGRHIVAGDVFRASVWDLGSRPGHRAAVLEALDAGLPVLSAKGDRLLAGTPGGAALCETSTGAVIATIETDPEANIVAAFSHDGRRLAIAERTRVRLFEAADGRPTQAFEHGDTLGIGGVAFNRSDDALLVFSTERLQLWDVATAASKWMLGAGTRSCFSTAHFSDDGGWIVAARGNARISVVSTDDPKTGVTVTGPKGDEFRDAWFAGRDAAIVAFDGLTLRSWTWPNPKGRGFEIKNTPRYAVSPNGDRVAASTGDRSGRIELLELATGKSIATLGRHTASVTALSWTADGSGLISGDEEGLLVFWAMSTRSVHGTMPTGAGQIGGLSTLPDGSGVVATCGENGIRIWRFAPSLAIRHLPGLFRSICVSAAGPAVAMPSDEGIAQWADGKTGLAEGPFAACDGHPRVCVASADGQWLAAIGGDEVLCVIDARTRETVRTWPAEDAHRLAFDAEGRRLLATGSDTCTVWDVVDDVSHPMVFAGSVGVNAAALSPDGRRVCIAETYFEVEGNVHRSVGVGGRVVDVDSGQTIAEILGGDDPRSRNYSCLSFSPDGSKVLMVRTWDGAVAVVNAADGSVHKLFGDDESRRTFAAWTPDGQAIVSSSGDGVEVWNASDGARLAYHEGYGDVRSMSFSHDASLAFTVSAHAVWVWDSATWTPLANLCDGIDRYPQSAAFTADGLGVFVVETDGRAAWYPVGREALCEAARPWASRST